MTSNSDFSCVLIKDDRLNVTPTIEYGVMRGGQSVVAGICNCPAPSATSMNFQIQVPSETTIVSRKVLWKSTFTASLTGTAPVGSFLVNYGVTDALAPYPAHQMVQVMNAVINQQNFTSNIAQHLSILPRLGDKRKLNRYNSGCPTAYDILNNYSDGMGSNNNVLGAFSNANLDNDFYPRGAFVLDYIGMNGDYATSSPLVASTGAAQTVYIKFTTSEHLMMSPFLFGDVTEKAGLYGIRTFAMNMTLAPSNQRFWRSANPWAVTSQVTGVALSQIFLEYISPHTTDLIAPKNCIPYVDLPFFKTPLLQSIASGATTQLTAGSLQLPSIPDALIIFVRKITGQQLCSDTDSFMTINNVNITFDNNAGILSNFSQNQLFLASVENGYNGSWEEFSGKANFSDSATGMGKTVPTSGSVLVLEFGKDIHLTSETSASGLIGNFNLQVSLNVTNNTASAFLGEIVILTMISGVITTSMGQTQLHTALLTRQDVLDASKQEPHFEEEAHRMVGSGFWDSAKSILGKVAPHAKKYLLNHDHNYANVAGNVLGALGYGKKKHSLNDRLQ